MLLEKPAEELLDRYLGAVARELRVFPPAEVKEILRELRSHVFERLEAGWDRRRLTEVLEQLGDARAIAREYLDLHRGPRDSTHLVFAGVAPGRQTGSFGMWARTVTTIVGALVVSSLAYGFAACSLYVALAKPFRPTHVGLWLLPDPNGDLNVSLGSHAGAQTAQELLGWWVIPLGVGLGAIVASLTWRWNLQLIRSWIASRHARSM